MTVFLIVLAVLFLLAVIILSLSAEFTIIFDNGWTTKIRVLFIEKNIKLTELLNFILFPEKAGADAAAETKEKAASSEAEQKNKTVSEQPKKQDSEKKAEDEAVTVDLVKEIEEQPRKEENKAKPNYIKKILDDDGIVGIMLLVSNLLQTVNSAITTLIKGLHIYSLYVKMIIGGGDAADIGEKYGAICGWYYPLKGLILNQMKVDNYDDYIQPDFIAPRSEYELQFIGSISVGLLVKVLLKAGKTFVINYFKNK